MIHSSLACCRVGRAPCPAFLLPSFLSSLSRCMALLLPDAMEDPVGQRSLEGREQLTCCTKVPHLSLISVGLDTDANFGIVASELSAQLCDQRRLFGLPNGILRFAKASIGCSSCPQVSFTVTLLEHAFHTMRQYRRRNFLKRDLTPDCQL